MEASESTSAATSAATLATQVALEQLDKGQVRGPWVGKFGNGWPWPCEARDAGGGLSASVDTAATSGGPWFAVRSVCGLLCTTGRPPASPSPGSPVLGCRCRLVFGGQMRLALLPYRLPMAKTLNFTSLNHFVFKTGSLPSALQEQRR